MSRDARSHIVLELMAEFVEDHVRQRSGEPFSLDEIKRSLGTVLEEAEVSVDLRPADEAWMRDWLDRHPLLLRQRATASAVWKSGLNTASVRRA